MAVTLLLVTFALAIRIIYRQTRSWHEGLIYAAIGWAAALVLLTELLGALRAITFRGVVTGWVVLSLALLLTVVARAKRGTSGPPVLRGRDAGESPVPEKSGNLVAIVGILLILLILGIVAVAAAPNNYDAMTYHLPRVMHWIQNRSLAFYPTAIRRQLHLGPAAEMIILNLQVLRGSDRLANLVQWAAFAGCIMASSLIARQLGGGVGAQSLAAVFSATLPMAILQATNAQNDLVSAFWMMAFISLGLRIIARTRSSDLTPLRQAQGRHSDLHSAAAGAALGLAALTKATAYPLMLPFCIWFAAALLRRSTERARSARKIALAASIALLLNLGQYSRNLDLYRSPLGPPGEGKRPGEYTYANATFTPSAICSNVLRNAAIEIATPWEALNARLDTAVRRAIDLVGADPDDPRTTWTGESFTMKNRPVYSEDVAANPLHVLFIAAAVPIFIARRRTQPSPTGAYMTAAFGAAFLFCVIFRWQPWHTRLHLPLLMMSAPAVGVVLGKAIHWSAACASELVLLAFAVPFILYGTSHPLTGDRSVFRETREAQYFVNNPPLRKVYEQIAARVRASHCRRVGIITGGNAFEYPLWPLLKADGPAVRIEQVQVENNSAKYADRLPYSRFHPCLVFQLKPAPPGALPSADPISR